MFRRQAMPLLMARRAASLADVMVRIPGGLQVMVRIPTRLHELHARVRTNTGASEPTSVRIRSTTQRAWSCTGLKGSSCLASARPKSLPHLCFAAIPSHWVPTAWNDGLCTSSPLAAPA